MEKSLDLTAALRQQRRRDKLKKLGLQKVTVLLSEIQIAWLDSLVDGGGAKDRSSALQSLIEEAFARRR